MKMFRYESEMIPVLISELSQIHKNSHFLTEFSTGNGIADLVFTTELRNQPMIFKDYLTTSLFVDHFNNKRRINRSTLYNDISNKKLARELLAMLELHELFKPDNEHLVKQKSYFPHTSNLISIEAKLNDWRSGLSQALRYQFYSHQSFLALPMQNIKRVNQELFKQNNVGLIGVEEDEVNIIINPIAKKPIDLTAYFFLSEKFALKIKSSI